MKKLPLMLVVLLLMVAPGLAEKPALEPHAIWMTEAQITFVQPENTICLMRDTSASVFNKWGMSQRDVIAYMEESCTYAFMFDVATEDEYLIVLTPWDEADFDVLTEAQAAEELRALRERMTRVGYEVHALEWRDAGGHAWICAQSSYQNENGDEEILISCYTRQAGYDLQVRAFPAESGSTETVRENCLALADSLVITAVRAFTPAEEFHVSTQERNDGYVVLGMPGVKMTFLPLDARYIVTRASGKNAFSRMGYMQKKTIRDMEELQIYAMLADKAQQVEIDVYLYGAPGFEDYARMRDADLYELERGIYLEYGWAIDQLDIIRGEAAKFTRAWLTMVEADGSASQYLNYCTVINGCKIEIQVVPQKKQALEKCEAMVETFIHSIGFEVTTE